MSHAKILSNLDIDDDQSINFNLSYSVLAGDSGSVSVKSAIILLI